MNCFDMDIRLNDFINFVKEAVHSKGYTTRDLFICNIETKDNHLKMTFVDKNESCEEITIKMTTE